jgi:hypothetical protein
LIAVARYVLGAAVYVPVAAIAFRPLRNVILASGSSASANAPQAAGALVAGIGLVAGIRLVFSSAGSAAFAPIASSGALAYLVLINAGTRSERSSRRRSWPRSSPSSPTPANG